MNRYSDLCARCENQFPPGQVCNRCEPAPAPASAQIVAWLTQLVTAILAFLLALWILRLAGFSWPG